MQKILSSLFIYTILLGSFAHGAEIDSYRNTAYLKDATSIVDKRANEWLKLAIEELNYERVACPANPEEANDVYDIVKSKMASPFIGHSIAVELDEALPIEKISRTDFDVSVYADISWLEGISLNLKGLLGVMNIGGRRVGVDKIGHFFVEGFGFFRRAYIKEEGSVEAAVRWGKFTENSYFGLTTTGVYSNADLIANFNGMRFWNMLFLFSKDPAFSRGKSHYYEKPFFSCVDSKWELKKRFSIRYFLDDSWDESLNCNYYDSEKIKDEVVLNEALNIGFYELEKNDGLVCPRVERNCYYEKYKYGDYAEDLLHESCFDKSKQYRVEASVVDLRNIPIGNFYYDNYFSDNTQFKFE